MAAEPPSQPESRYRMVYPVSEVAELVGYRKSVVYDMIARHELEAIHVRGELRVPHDALVSFIERLRAETNR